MDLQAVKAQDEQFESYTIRSVKDADAGYSLGFDGTDLTYWIPKSYKFIPKPGDVARIFGKLVGIPRKVKVHNGFVHYNETNNAEVRGLDIVRIVKDDGVEKKQRVELFYEPAKAKEPAGDGPNMASGRSAVTTHGDGSSQDPGDPGA